MAIDVNGPVVLSGGTLTFGMNGFTATTLEVSSNDTVKFQAGETFTLTNLTLSGSAGSLVTFRATLDVPMAGTYFLDVDGRTCVLPAAEPG